MLDFFGVSLWGISGEGIFAHFYLWKFFKQPDDIKMPVIYKLTVVCEGNLMKVKYFVTNYGAPDIASAIPVAKDEINFMIDMCKDQSFGSIFWFLNSISLR